MAYPFISLHNIKKKKKIKDGMVRRRMLGVVYASGVHFGYFSFTEIALSARMNVRHLSRTFVAFFHLHLVEYYLCIDVRMYDKRHIII